jgi:F0F1-type ATP synthase assembly protein I
MLYALQSDSSRNDDKDRPSYWSEGFDDDWEFKKVIEKDRPVNREVADVKSSDAKAAVKKNAGEGKSGRKKGQPSEPAPADLMSYASLGTELLASIIVGVLLTWAVSWLIGLITGHRPTWIIAIGVVLGAAAGFLNMYRFIVEENKEEERRRHDSSRY